MIFVTVGAQLPFDRLVHAVDAWAARTGRDDVFAQVGQTRQPPSHICWTRMLDPIDYRHHFWEADLVIAHAGAGTILTAMEMSRPLLVMPRRAEQSETRSNHQFATARQFRSRTSLAVAHDETELFSALDDLESIKPMSRIGSYASPTLLNAVRTIIETGSLPQPQLRYVPATPGAEVKTASNDARVPRRKAA